MLEKYTFKGQEAGRHVLFTGRIHGNEPCGEVALRRLQDNLENNTVTLKKGSLTLMPCCNPKAAQMNKRFVDVNLNRIMSEHLVEEYLEAYEANLAPIIMDEIKKADIFVDLHSFTENMPPVVICIDDQNNISRALSEACRIKRIECDSPMITKAGAQMTIHFARHLKKPTTFVECGQHDDPQAIEVAYQSILNILIHLNMIDGDLPEPIDHEFLVIRSALHREEGQKLIFPLMEQDYIKAGDAVFETEHGDILHAHHSGLLFMRNVNTPVGEEYAYICDVLDDWP
jgi:predicted deacylase